MEDAAALDEQVRTLATPSGPARVAVAGSGRGLLVLGHGAGGGPRSPDLLAVRAAGLDAGLRVALVEQPWRVAGRRVAEAPARLDAAWHAVLSALVEPARPPLLVLGGRSAGARVACRTAAVAGADAVLCLAFPLQPPARAGRTPASRQGELDAVAVPLLVVQGGRDAFGVPSDAVVLPGADHAVAVRRGDADPLPVLRATVAAWLAGLRRQRD